MHPAALDPLGVEQHASHPTVRVGVAQPHRLPVGRLIPTDEIPLPWDGPEGAGSVIVLCATDAPLLPHQCDRLAQRCALGIGRTGGAGEHTSGDLILAFSTVLQGVPAAEEPARGDPATIPLTMVPDNRMNPLFYAAVEATEAAIVDALLSAETMTGCGATAYALTEERLREAITRLSR